MRCLLFITFVFAAVNSFAQLTVDTTRTSVIVKDKSPGSARTLTIYKTVVEGSGIRSKATYQPVAEEIGEEPETLRLTFAGEAPNIKKMLEAAAAKRKFNFSSFSMSILPYSDLTAKLVEIYTTSTDWQDYLKKATNLKQTTTLFDGSEVTEVHFYAKMAKYVLDKSDFYNELSALFTPYGYKVTSVDFPEEHQQTLSADKLMLMGKDGNLFIPVPDHSFTLTKIKK